MNNMRLVGSFLGIAAWTVLSSPARADDPSDTVARYRLWRGGAAFEDMRAVRLEGRANTSGLNGPMSILATAEGDFRRDLDLGVVQTIDVRQGDSGWNLTQSGQVEELAPDVAADLYRDAVLLFDDVLDDPARLTIRPDVALEGRTFDVLAVDFGDADTHELYFDETDGALYGMRIMRDRQEGFTKFDDWRFVEGVRMPFAQTTIREGESPVSVTWSEIAIDPEVQQSTFERPQIGPLHSIAGDARSTGFLPFEFLGGARIYIPATVGTEQTEVLLDSGAEMTVLDLALARRLGLALEGEVVVQGTGGLATGQFASGVDIQLGPLAFHDLTVLVLDLEPIARAIGRQRPVILGKDAFNALIVDVDFPNRRIAFHEIDGFTPPDDAAEIDLVSTGDIRAVRLSIEGRPAELFDFDTGNGGGLIIYPAYAEAEGLLDGRMHTLTRAGGVGGVRENRLATIRSLQIGAFEVRDVPTVFPPAGLSAVDSDRTVGNVGLGVLSRFRLISSFGDSRAWLVADPAALTAPFTRNRTGLFLNRQSGAIVVDQVAPGSPAEEGGWAIGDRVLAINGIVADDLGPDDLREIVSGPAGRLITFSLQGGGSRNIQARDYY